MFGFSGREYWKRRKKGWDMPEGIRLWVVWVEELSRKKGRGPVTEVQPNVLNKSHHSIKLVPHHTFDEP